MLYYITFTAALLFAVVIDGGGRFDDLGLMIVELSFLAAGMLCETFAAALKWDYDILPWILIALSSQLPCGVAFGLCVDVIKNERNGILIILITVLLVVFNIAYPIRREHKYGQLLDKHSEIEEQLRWKP